MLVKVSSFLQAGSSLQKIFVQLNFFSVRSSAYKEGAVIQGSMALSKWPEVLHLCLDSPATLSPEEVTEGLLINRQRYRFNGLVHNRGDGVWNVSVKRTVDACEHRGWNLVDRGSVRKPMHQQELLSQVVMVQLIVEKEGTQVQEDGRQDAHRVSFPINDYYCVQHLIS